MNGEVRQRSNTKYLIFDVAKIVSYISSVMTLHPGDVISTGTPAGVGFAMSPQVFLKPGDVVEVEIEGIGVLANPARLALIAYLADDSRERLSPEPCTPPCLLRRPA